MKSEHLLEQLSQTTTAHILLLFDAELPKSLDSYGLSQLVRKEVTLIGGGRISSFKSFSMIEECVVLRLGPLSSQLALVHQDG